MKKYDIIYADPPWQYKDKAMSGKRGVHFKYPVMNISDICKLDVQNICSDNCILFLWSTPPLIKDAFKVIDAWGFEYKTKGFCWVKYNRNIFSVFMGMGNYSRSNTEDCLLGVKGKPKRLNADVRQLIQHPIMKHSMKPPETRDRIVRLMGDIPRIELFSRQKTPGWDVWGNEVKSDITL